MSCLGSIVGATLVVSLACLACGGGEERRDAAVDGFARGDGPTPFTDRSAGRDLNALTLDAPEGTVCQQAAAWLKSCGLSSGGIESYCTARNQCYAKCFLAASCEDLRKVPRASGSLGDCLAPC